MLDEAPLAEGFWRALHGQQSWDDAVRDLSRRFDGLFGEVAVAGPRGEIDHIRIHNVSQIGLADVLSHGVYSPVTNPRIGAAVTAPVGGVVTDADFLMGRDPATIDLYRKFLIPTGASEVMIAKLPARIPSGFAVFTVSRPQSRGAASRDECAALAALLPGIGGAVEMAARFGTMETDALVAAMARDDTATLALGLSRRPVALSAAAEEMLARGRHLVRRHHRIHAASRHSDMVLARALDDVLAGCALHRGVRRVVLRPVDEDGPPVVAVLSPVPARGGGVLSAASVLMTIQGRPLGDDHAAALRDGFDMTRAETAVVMGLAAGLDLQTIARDRGVSYETIRAQLRAAMAKTATSRQSELVALVSALFR